MTVPPSPLTYVLETVREIRMALAYVPRLCALGKFEEASECISEQLHQLAELRPEAERLAGISGQGVIDGAQAVAGAATVLVELERQFAAGPKPDPRSALGGLGRIHPDDGFADVPLF